jgi:hypothetical protein
MPKWIHRCPYFSSCIIPCIHGMSSYYFVTHTCLTVEHEMCTTYYGHHPTAVIGPEPSGVSPQEYTPVNKNGWGRAKKVDPRLRKMRTDISVLDDLQECPRLTWCLKKKEHPVEEYQEIVCRTPEHGNCLFYFIWYQNGSDPNDDMSRVEIDGGYFKQLETMVQTVTGARPHFQAPYPTVDVRGLTAEEINNGKLHGNSDPS